MDNKLLKLSLLDDSSARIELAIINVIINKIPFSKDGVISVTEDEFYFQTNEVFLFHTEESHKFLEPHFYRFTQIGIFSKPPSTTPNQEGNYVFHIQEDEIIEYRSKLENEVNKRKVTFTPDWFTLENDKFIITLKNGSHTSFSFTNPDSKVFFEILINDFRNNTYTNRDTIIKKINLITGRLLSYDNLATLRHNLSTHIEEELKEFKDCVKISNFDRSRKTYILNLNRL